MRLKTSTVAGLFAATCAAAAIGAAPAALADDSCDPAVVECDAPGNVDSPGNVEINDAPPPSDASYPFDNDWYFNPAGGGTALQPNDASHSGGGGATGGGGHR